jgi:DNA-binding transcriptional LysR family regulator
MDFRINDLMNFINTAECRTMAEASKKLGITQPALSESIKRFEQDLKLTLFYRSRSGIELTLEGREIYLKSLKAHDSLNDVLQIKNTEFNLKILKIGCHPTVAAYTLPQAFKKFKKIYPDYKIKLEHGSSAQMQYLVQTGKVDCALVVNPIRHPDLVIKKLGNDEVGFYKSRGEFDESKIFCNTQMVQVQSLLRKIKKSKWDIIETDNLELIVRFVSSGLGVGILPNRVVKLFQVQLDQIEKDNIFVDEICLVFRPEFGKTKVQRDFIDSVIVNFK